ncbi:MAG: ATP-binding cassette domain-containing protein [Thermosphaera sp.]
MLRICAGDVYCILGPNGAGKTSIIKSIVGIHKPETGEVKVLCVNPWVDFRVKNKIGMLPAG